MIKSGHGVCIYNLNDGYSERSKKVGEYCNGDSDCKSGFCNNQVDEKCGCLVDADCKTTQTCTNRKCLTKVGKGCGRDVDCVSNYCLDDFCACRKNSHCESGSVCEVSTGSCG